MANLAAGVWKDADGAVVVVVQNTVAPTQAEWNSYCAQIGSMINHPNAGGLAITDGGGPNAAQRGQVNDLLAGRQANSAVVTDSRLVRGIVTALSWFNRQTAAFSPAKINKAMEFAGVKGERAHAVWELVLKLNAQIQPQSATVKEALRHIRF